MHPLLRLAMTQPGLLGEHAQGYAALLTAELVTLQQRTRQRLLWMALTLATSVVTLVLGGVALMLWAALPGLAGSALWLMWATPGLALVATLACLLQLRPGTDAPAFAQLQAQLQVDWQLFKEASPP
jgi:hypothetical protein